MTEVRITDAHASYEQILEQARQGVMKALNTPEGRAAQVQGLINGKADAAFDTPNPPASVFGATPLSIIEKVAYLKGYDENK